MKTILIVGGTREAARQRLKEIIGDNGLVRRDFCDEATLDGYRLLAISGEPEDVCFLRAVGFQGVEIVTVEEEAISEAMRKRINYVRSARRM